MNTTTELTEEQAIAYLKKRFPKMRRSGSTAIIHSGGRRTIFGCLCGSEHTTSTDWNGRDALHVRVWRSEHEGCAAKLAAAHQNGEKISVYIG